MARPLSAIMKTIHSMSDQTAPKDFFGMIYAEFGVGKTTTIMGLAQALRGDGKILFADSSDGWVSLQEFPALMEGADRFRATDPADLLVIANAMDTGQMKGYTVVVIDELSSLFDVMLEQHLRSKHSLSPDDPLPEAEGREYGPPTAAMASLLRKFHALEGVHLLVTAHAREVSTEGVKELRASFPPQAYKEVMRRTHVTAALSARRRKNQQTKEIELQRTLQLKPSAAVAAKSRIRNSPISCDPAEFIDLVVDWLDSDDFVADTQHETTEEVIEELTYEDEPQMEHEAGDDDAPMVLTDDVVEEPEEPAEEDDLDALIDELPEPTTGPTLLLGADDDIPSRDQREKDLKKFTVKDLRNYISSQWDLDTTGIKKDGLIAGILTLEYDQEGGE